MYVNERVRTHPVPDSALSVEAEMLTEAVQLSEAVALPADGNEDGLQPSEEDAGQEVNAGASVSTV